MTIWLSDLDRGGLIEPLPENVVVTSGIAQSTIAILFADDAKSIRDKFSWVNNNLFAPKSLWIAYPKANRTDINRDSLWAILGEFGMRPISQVALNDVWSVLRFRKLHDGEAAFTGG